MNGNRVAVYSLIIMRKKNLKFNVQDNIFYFAGAVLSFKSVGLFPMSLLKQVQAKHIGKEMFISTFSNFKFYVLHNSLLMSARNWVMRRIVSIIWPCLTSGQAKYLILCRNSPERCFSNSLTFWEILICFLADRWEDWYHSDSGINLLA